MSIGTPVSNSMTELYTMMRYLQTELLRDCGINHFDEWAADFGEVKTDYELKPESDGKYQLKTRFAKFTNLPELMGMFKEAADIRTADTLDLEKPISHVHEVVAQPSKIQRRLIKSLAKRASKIRDGKVDPKEDNMLCVTNDGRKIGLDQRLMQPGCPDNPNSKVNMCVQNVFDMQEKENTVFIVATANDISRMPPEFLRKGRFDELFFVDLPNGEERRKIIEIHLKKRNKWSRNIDSIALIKETDGFNGADLEAVVKDTIELAFIEGRSAITTDDLIKTVKDTKSISSTLKEKIKEIKATIEKIDIKPASKEDQKS